MQFTGFSKPVYSNAFEYMGAKYKMSSLRKACLKLIVVHHRLLTQQQGCAGTAQDLLICIVVCCKCICLLYIFLEFDWIFFFLKVVAEMFSSN